MPRRNNRDNSYYPTRLGFNPRKYTNPITYGHMNGDRWTAQSQPFRGDIWFATLGYMPGTHIIEGRHPVLVVSNNETNYRGATITVIPITSNTSRLYMPTQIGIYDFDLARVSGARVSKGSVAEDSPSTDDDRTAPAFKNGALLLDQITTIDKATLRDYVGRVKAEKLDEVDAALLRQLGMRGSASLSDSGC